MILDIHLQQIKTILGTTQRLRYPSPLVTIFPESSPYLSPQPSTILPINILKIIYLRYYHNRLCYKIDNLHMLLYAIQHPIQLIRNSISYFLRPTFDMILLLLFQKLCYLLEKVILDIRTIL